MNKWNMKKIPIIVILGMLVIIATGFGGHNYTMATQYDTLIKGANSITANSVEDIVRELIIKDSNLGAICEFDHEEILDGIKYFVVHVYDVVVDHTSTWGWYYINQNNGKVFNGTHGDLTPMN